MQITTGIRACYSYRIFLSIVLFCNPFTVPWASADQASLAGANQTDQGLIQGHLKDFNQRKSYIDSMLFALKQIIDETQQAIPFARIEDKSRLQISQAEILYRKGNHFAGQYLMDITYREIQDLVIQSRDGSTLTQNRKPGDQYEVRPGELKSDRDFESLNVSIDALTQALDRVAEEKNMQHSTRVVQDNVAKIREQAFRLKDSNDASAAFDSLRKAYSLTRGALSALRDGETLIMSLDFANKKEEYKYYLDKNESQKFVLTMLAELNPGTKTSEMLQRLLNSVEPLLARASNLAAMDDYESAVPIMDKAYYRLQSGLMMALSSR